MRLSRKGERSGAKKTLYLAHIWNDMLKDGKKKSGMSQSEIVEWCLSNSWEDFKEKFGLNEKEAKSKKDKKLILNGEEALKLGKIEFMKYAERTCAERHFRNILYGRNNVNVDYEGFIQFMKLEPQSILDRIKGKFTKRPDNWRNRGWEEYHG